MTEKQQIEELDTKLREIVHSNIVKVDNYSKFGGHDGFRYYLTNDIAKQLVKQGYQKVDEGKVTLKGEQWVEILQDNYNIGYNRASKETAREILQELTKKVYTIPQHHFTLSEILYEIDKIAKRYDVEVE